MRSHIISYWVLFLLVFGIGTVWAQDMTVKGIIKDSEGEVLIGATVTGSGTDVATITDVDGFYELRLPVSVDRLVVSYLGNIHERSLLEIKAAAGPGATLLTFNITLNLEILLKEVVVSSVGIERERRSLGYDVADLSSKEILDSQENNVARALSGKVAGVYVTSGSGVPGANAQVTIRGAASLLGNNNPLYVIDGIPIDNSTAGGGSTGGTAGTSASNRAIDINPDDVADIQILKSGAATALYGLRGANGVILITTKKGGENDEAFNINLSSNVGVSVQNGMTPVQNQYAQGSYHTKGVDEVFRGAYGDLLGVSATPYWYRSANAYHYPHTGTPFSYGPPVLDLAWATDPADWRSWRDLPVDEEEPYGDLAARGPQAWDANGAIRTLSEAKRTGITHTPISPYNNIDNFYRPGYSYDHTLSIDGRKKDLSYYVSVGHLNNNGMVPHSQFDRLSSKLNLDYRITPRFRTSFGITYANTYGRRPQQGSNISGTNLGLMRTPPTFDNTYGFGRDGANERSAYQFLNGEQRNYRGGTGFDNPLWIVNNIVNVDRTHRVIGKLEFNYFPLDWMSVMARVGNDFYNTDFSNGFTSFSNSAPAGLASEASLFNQDVNTDVILQVDRPLTRQLNLTTIVGHNLYEVRSRSTSVSGVGLGVNNLYDVSNSETVFGGESQVRLRRHGLYFDVGLAYNDWVYLNITGRNDWSSTLIKENRSFFYPSVSTSLLLSELIPDGASAFSLLKLRGSYAVLGRDAPVYSWDTFFTLPSTADGYTGGIVFPAFGQLAYSRSDGLGNRNIRPEKVTTIEGGFDMGLLEGRLDLGFTYFDYESKDQVLPVSLSNATGYGAITVNAGTLISKGIELNMGGVPVRSKSGFEWDVRGTWYTYRNELRALPPGIETLFLGGFASASSRAVVGEPYASIYGGVWNRSPDRRLIIRGDSGPDFNEARAGFPYWKGTSEVIGDSNPDWLATLRNSLSYKGLTLSFLFDLRWGGEIWNGTKGALTYFGNSELSAEYRDKVAVFDGVVEVYDAAANVIGYRENTRKVLLDEYNWFVQGQGHSFGNVDETFVEDATSFRLRDLSVSYTLPDKLLDRARVIKRINITLTGTNLWVWTTYDGNSGLDPDTSLTAAAGSSQAQNARGLDYFQFPNVRAYSATLRLGF